VIDLLLILLPLALKYETNKLYFPITLVALILDVIIAHTSFALMAGFPKKNEWTISQCLERLCKEYSNPDVELFRQIAIKINRVSPNGNHIKAVGM
jgi:hypothetical protein